VKKDLRATEGLRVSDDDVADAIRDAVAFYETERFSFNEGNGDNGAGVTIDTVAGADAYAVPVLALQIDEIQYLQGNADYYLTRWSWGDYRRAVSDRSAVQGPSTHYALHGGYLYFYPTPDSVTTITISGIVRLTPYPLTAASATNAWTEVALPLIRAHAAWDLSINRLQNPDMAANFAIAENIALGSLRSRTIALIATGQAQVDDWDSP
jgi:hypothetical protein